MPDTKNRFLDRILDGKAGITDERKSFSSERQHTAQAFNLQVERRDGRQSEGLAWSHYAGFQWSDLGDHERLVVIFGARAVEIEGHNLGVLVDEIRDGQLNSIREMTTVQAELKRANAEDGPIIGSVKVYPDFDEILESIKGNDDDQNRHTRKLSR